MLNSEQTYFIQQFGKSIFLHECLMFLNTENIRSDM